MTTARKLTGPTHPLRAYVREADREIGQHLDTAARLVRAHHQDGTSDTSVFRLPDEEYVGPLEHHPDLLGQAGYIIVGRGRDDLETVAAGLAGRDLRRLALASKLIAAAEVAAPMVSALLAVALVDGLEWDTGETVTEASHRLSMDAAWRIQCAPVIEPTAPSSVYDAVVDMMGGGLAASDCAARYLISRATIRTLMGAAGIAWGGTHLTAIEAADRSGVVSSTWRAYVARQEAPAEDLPGRWRPTTVDAWRLLRPRAGAAAWWE